MFFAGLCHARVIHQNVNPPHAREHGIYEPLCFGVEGKVGDDGEYVVAFPIQLACAGMDAFCGGSDHHTNPNRQQLARHREADAFGASGSRDQRRLLA